MTLQPRPRTGLSSSKRAITKRDEHTGSAKSSLKLRSPRGQMAGVATALTLGAFALGACDSTATIYVSTAQFSNLQFVGSFPAKRNVDGTFTRVCGNDPSADSLVANVVFQSTVRNESEKDLSIRPRDVISAAVVDGQTPDDIHLSSAGNYQLSLSCISPGDTTSGCASTNAVPATVSDVRYIENTSGRDVGHNVLVLIDQSGSMTGLVDSTTYRETSFPTPPSNFGAIASDGARHRFSSTARLLRSLNQRDQPGVLSFSANEGVKVLCTAATTGSLETDFNTCFGALNTTIWEGALQTQSSTQPGRSNLWQAVETAHDLLAKRNDRTRSNHIIVLTDGPDTCAGEERTDCENACQTTNYRSLVSKLEAAQNDPGVPDIKIHFVQWESIGYPGRDPRQQEVSCLSGGLYQYINSNQFPSAQNDQFQTALERAVNNVRYSLMGHWQIAAQIPAMVENATTPVGDVYATEGSLLLRSGSNLLLSDRVFPFGYGVNTNTEDTAIANWDRRLSFRRACASNADCGGDVGECQIACSPETFTCGGLGNTGTTQPNLASCNGGSCCEGACVQGSGTSGQCGVCSN